MSPEAVTRLIGQSHSGASGMFQPWSLSALKSSEKSLNLSCTGLERRRDLMRVQLLLVDECSSARGLDTERPCAVNAHCMEGAQRELAYKRIANHRISPRMHAGGSERLCACAMSSACALFRSLRASSSKHHFNHAGHVTRLTGSYCSNRICFEDAARGVVGAPINSREEFHESHFS